MDSFIVLRQNTPCTYIHKHKAVDMIVVEQMLGVLENICSGEGDRVLNAITYRIR